MYNKTVVDRLVAYIEKLNGIGDKNKLADAVQKEFSLVQDRKVYYCTDFAIRFSKSESKRMSNTVLSLSALQKYDDKPFFVCIVASTVNYLLLANSTFLKKISHSSKELRIDNIKGSFNGGDIMLVYDEMDNEPQFFDRLYAYHSGLSFADNLERLVASTNDIVGRVPKFEVNDSNKGTIMSSVSRAQSFIASADYKDLKSDLDSRVKRVQGEIAIAAFIDNVNLRGRVIEYLITDGKATLDNGYGMFTKMLAYKLHDRGKQLVVIDRWFPSSQICHTCGYRNPITKDLKIRTVACPVCHKVYDRDYNAALNIRDEGIRQYLSGLQAVS